MPSTEDITHHPLYIKLLDELKVLKLELERLKQKMKAPQGMSLDPKLNSCLTNLTPTPCSNARSSQRPAKKKLVIISDSMGRGLAYQLRQICPQLNITSHIYPNARFEETLKCSLELCSNLTKNDYLLILSGTNNMESLPPNACPYLNLNKVQLLNQKTNVFLCCIPYRHDSLSWQNTNIYYTNEYLYHKCSQLKVNLLDCSFLKRSGYTRHGLHLNVKGKVSLCTKIKKLIHLHFDSKQTPIIEREASLEELTPLDHSSQLNLSQLSCPNLIDISLVSSITSEPQIDSNDNDLNVTFTYESPLIVVENSDSEKSIDIMPVRSYAPKRNGKQLFLADYNV